MQWDIWYIHILIYYSFMKTKNIQVIFCPFFTPKLSIAAPSFEGLQVNGWCNSVVLKDDTFPLHIANMHGSPAKALYRDYQDIILRQNGRPRNVDIYVGKILVFSQLLLIRTQKVTLYCKGALFSLWPRFINECQCAKALQITESSRTTESESKKTMLSCWN